MKSRYLEEAELEALSAQITEEAWLPLAVALETGLRVGDVVKLRRAALKADGIHYRAQKTRKCGVAKISAELRAKLPKRGVWLFPSPQKSGAHITRQAVWARIKKAAKRAGIELAGVSPHSCRKVFAVELFREKGFRAAQEALQHTNSLTTEIYTYADWNTGSNAAKPLERRDLELIVKLVLEALGDAFELKKESKTKPKGKGGRSSRGI